MSERAARRRPSRAQTRCRTRQARQRHASADRCLMSCRAGGRAPDVPTIHGTKGVFPPAVLLRRARRRLRARPGRKGVTPAAEASRCLDRTGPRQAGGRSTGISARCRPVQRGRTAGRSATACRGPSPFHAPAMRSTVDPAGCLAARTMGDDRAGVRPGSVPPRAPDEGRRGPDARPPADQNGISSSRSREKPPPPPPRPPRSRSPPRSSIGPDEPKSEPPPRPEDWPPE
jgi:hypothetical protein